MGAFARHSFAHKKHFAIPGLPATVDPQLPHDLSKSHIKEPASHDEFLRRIPYRRDPPAALATRQLLTFTVLFQDRHRRRAVGQCHCSVAAVETRALPVERVFLQLLGGTQVCRASGSAVSGQYRTSTLNTLNARFPFSMSPKADVGKQTPKPPMPAPLNWTPTKTT